MLEAHDLAGHRGTTALFTGVSFRVGAGSALLVSGRNGSGKTTLLRILAGLAAAAAGGIRWRGEPVHPFASSLRRDVVFCGHSIALKDELTAEENVTSLLTLTGSVASPDAVRAALDEVSLGRQRGLPARVLSAGQRRRIGLARLRLVRRPLWVLDEPLTALDAAGGELLASLVASHLDEGGVAVAATHQSLGVAAHRVVALALGDPH